MSPLGMYNETLLFWVIWSCTNYCLLNKEPFMVFVVAVVTIYSCVSLWIIKIALLCCFGFFLINLVSGTTMICASVSSLKVLNVHFAFKLEVHSSSAGLPIDLPWAAHGASAFLLSVAHTLLVFTSLRNPFSLLHSSPAALHFFSLYCFAALCMLPWAVLNGFTLCLLTFLLSHFKYNFNFHQCYLHCSNINRFQWNSMAPLGAILLPIVITVSSVISPWQWSWYNIFSVWGGLSWKTLCPNLWWHLCRT